MDFLLSKTIRQHYSKIMLHALHIINKVISKEIELKTFLQCSFIHIDSRIVVKLMFNKYAQVTSSRLIHKIIVNLNIQETNILDWNASTEGH